MPMNNDKKQRIKEVIKQILLKRTENFPTIDTGNRNAPFHKIILDAFEERLGSVRVPIPYLVAIASWMHGLNTSLGNGFESLAHILSGGYKRSFTGNFRLKVYASQTRSINNIIVDLKSGSQRANLERENDLIFNYNVDEDEEDALEFTADNYLERSSLVEAIELKSVRPNSGEGRGEKQKILFGKAAFKKLYPNKNIKFFIGFPFDPTATRATDYNKERFFDYLIEFRKFFDPREVLLAGELWDKLSGSRNTMQELLDITADTVRDFVQN